MKLIRPVTMVAAACALTACASLNPFGADREEGPRAPEEGRISILAFEQALEADQALAGRRPATPAPTALPAWSLPGGGPDNAPGSIAGPEAPRVLWRRQVVDGSDNRARLAAPPVIADGWAFLLGADQTLVAVDLGSGRPAWRVSMRPRDNRRDRQAIGGGVAVSDGRVYAVSGYGVATAVDAATGAEIWRAQGSAPFAGAPTVVGGRLFAVTNDSELFAIDARTGDVLWTHQAIAEPARILTASNAAVVGDIVYAPFPSGEIIALLAPNGRRLWVDALTRAGRLTSLSAINDVAGRPVAYDGAIYAASHSGVLAAIDQRSGARRWARGFASTQTPWVAGDALFAVSVDGELAAFDIATGRAFWVTQLRRYRDEEDREGRVAWAGPILVGGKLFLANSLGDAVTVNPQTGAVESEIEIGGPVYITPVAADGVIYVLTDEGRLVALG